MSAIAPLDIRVVYPASSGRGRAHRAYRAHSSTLAGGGGLVVGIMSLVCAGLAYYATWWPVDRGIYRTLMMKAPVVGVDPGEAIVLLGAPRPPRDSAKSDPAGSTHEKRQTQLSAATAAVKRIGVVAYAWLGLSTVSYCLLALAAGTCFGKSGANRWRRGWVILTAGGVVFMAFAGWDLWRRYNVGYPPDQLRYGMGTLGVLGLLIGLSIGVRARMFVRLAGVSLIFAAVGSAAGVCLWSRYGALEPRFQTWTIVGLVFVVHSLFGWLLLFPLASRLSR